MSKLAYPTADENGEWRGGNSLIFAVTVNGNTVADFIDKRGGASRVVGGGEGLFHELGEVPGLVEGVPGLFVVAIRSVYVVEDGHAPGGLVEGLRSAWAGGVPGGVVLVYLGFLFGAARVSLPVAADFVVDEVVGGEIGLAGARPEFDDLAQFGFVHVLAEPGFLFLCGGQAGEISFVKLPANVGCSPCGFGSERRTGVKLDEALIEQPGSLTGVARAASVGGE
uniref:Uncharacterized protein n=1 Tax=mine drainage metagenome TaxID=410659 RepID=E6QIA9_9ZZZZ